MNEHLIFLIWHSLIQYPTHSPVRIYGKLPRVCTCFIFFFLKSYLNLERKANSYKIRSADDTEMTSTQGSLY